MRQDIVVRFAPSPNGFLHLGHAYAAMRAHDFARENNGRFLLRMEDIDAGRTRPEYIDAILCDLRWLGLDWDGEVIFQSDRFVSYVNAVDDLRNIGVLYPCFCSRRDLVEAGAKTGQSGLIYPGTCRLVASDAAEQRIKNEPHCWRLDVNKAHHLTGPLYWHDLWAGEQLMQPELLGDVIIAPRETTTSYHLAVTLDDARDGITHVVRGMDLFASTHVHRLLQALLKLPAPIYAHHKLLLDENGEKLSKSRGSASLSVLRKRGESGIKLLDRLRKNKLPLGITLSED